MASLCQACSSSSATPLLLAKRVFSLASSSYIFTSGHKIHRHCSSFRSFTSVSASASALTSVSVDLKEVRSNELVDLEYAELNLKYKISEEVGHVRIRQHVNPLSSSFSKPAPIPVWDEVYKDPSLPLMVDIGSGSGRFLLWLAKKNAEPRNYLGLEICQKVGILLLLTVSNHLTIQFLTFHCSWSSAPTFGHFIFANAMVSFEQLISRYPGPLEIVSILCPDPHFKKRHQKRRDVQKPLVFVQSDVLEVAQDMRDQLDEESNVLQHVDTEDGWLMENPMGIRTEREIHAEFEGARIYRRLYHNIQLTTT